MCVRNKIPKIRTKVVNMTNSNAGGFYITNIYDNETVMTIIKLDMIMCLARYLVWNKSYTTMNLELLIISFRNTK